MDVFDEDMLQQMPIQLLFLLKRGAKQQSRSGMCEWLRPKLGQSSA